MASGIDPAPSTTHKPRNCPAGLSQTCLHVVTDLTPEVGTGGDQQTFGALSICVVTFSRLTGVVELWGGVRGQPPWPCQMQLSREVVTNEKKRVCTDFFSKQRPDCSLLFNFLTVPTTNVDLAAPNIAAHSTEAAQAPSFVTSRAL